MAEKLVWHTEQRKVNDLVPFEFNPRLLTEKQAKDLEASIDKFNLVEIPAINTDNTVCAGHQRLAILKLKGRGEEIIDVRVPNRPLTKEEFEEYNVRSNKNTGEWDWDILLNNFNADNLKEWGFKDSELTGFDTEGSFYSSDVKVPTYEPKNEKPKIEDLVNTEKVDSLIAEINQSNVPDEIKKFLTMSAYRHYVFDYGLIADFYAHADKDTQNLMENSALVIVDFKKAIELGYVRLIENLASIQNDDYNA